MAEGKQSKFEMVIGAVDRFSGVFKGFNDRLSQTTAKMAAAKAAAAGLSNATGFSRLTSAVSGVGAGMSKVVSEGQRLAGTVAGFAAKFSLVFGAAGGGLFALVKHTADAGDAAIKSAQRAGVGVEVWQEYAYAAKIADLSQEQLIKGFGGLQEAALKAAGGAKEPAAAFKRLGIGLKTASGEVKNSDTLFLELADKVQALQAAGKEAEAVNILGKIMGGKEARAFLPLLSDGRKGLLAMRQEAHDINTVLSKEDAQASGAFAASLTKLTSSFQGLGFAISGPMLKPLTALMEKFTAWIGLQSGVIKGGFKEWVESWDIDAIWKSIEDGLESIKAFGREANEMVGKLGGWKNMLMAVGAVIAGPFLLSIGNLALAFGKLGLAILTTPVGWFLAACAAIGAAVYVIYKNWDSIVAYFQGLWQGVKDAFSRSWTEGILTVLRDFNPVLLLAKGMTELLAYFTGFDLFEAGTKLVQSFADGFSSIWGQFVATIKEKVAALTDWMPDWVKDKLGLGGSGGASGSWSAAPQAEPLNMAPTARSLSESRSERVERNEVRMKIELPPGLDASITGNPGDGLRWAQIGHQMGP